MKRATIIGLPIVLSCLLTSSARAQGKGPRGGDEREAVRNGWFFSLDEGKAQARKAGKPLMVVIRCVP